MVNYTLSGDFNGPVSVSSYWSKETKKKVKALKIADKSLKSLFKLDSDRYISKETVEHYEVVDTESKKSMGSGIVRGTVGGALFGGVGAIAGAVSGKSKSKYTVRVSFKDGTASLIELDAEMYKQLLIVMT